MPARPKPRKYLAKKKPTSKTLPAVRPTEAPLAAGTPYALLQQALASGASVEALNGLMDLQERHEKNEARRAFDNAIAAARAELPVIVKAHSASFGGKGAAYQYEDLASIARVVDPILASHGLGYRFRTESVGPLVVVTCVISHLLGHREENSLSAGADMSGSKNPLHGLGSTVTYLERYTLKAALGLAAAKDDDGHAAFDDPPPKSAHRLRKEEVYPPEEAAIRACTTLEGLRFYQVLVGSRITDWPETWKQHLRDEWTRRWTELEEGVTEEGEAIPTPLVEKLKKSLAEELDDELPEPGSSG